MLRYCLAAILAAMAVIGCSRTERSINWTGTESIVASCEAGGTENWRYFVLEGDLVPLLQRTVEENTELEGSDVQLMGGEISLVCCNAAQQPLRLIAFWWQSAAGMGGKHAPAGQRDAAMSGQAESRMRILAVLMKGREIDQAEYERINPNVRSTGLDGPEPYLEMQSAYYRN